MEDQTAEVEKFLTAAEILGRSDSEVLVVEVPEWGGSIRLRTLTAGEAALFVDIAADKGKAAEANITILTMSAVDEDGNQLFKKRDIEALKGKTLKVMRRLAKAALKHNGLDDEEEKKAAKNG